MSHLEFSIRRADASDARALAKVAESTFRASFSSTNSAEDLDLHCRNQFGESIQKAEILDQDRVNLLCESNGEIIGFAQLRPGTTPSCVKGQLPGEIQRLYVVASAHGSGAAQQLMAACIEETRLKGCDVVWLGVWEKNPRAIAFYRKIGFVEAGEKIFQLGTDPQRDLVMAKFLEV